MKSRLLFAGAMVASVLVAGCGSSSPSTSESPSPAAATIAVATNSKLGQILVDGKGITVYLFVKDTGQSSTCYTSCAQVWPPVLTSGPPQAVTYAGHPLYYFVSDKQPGDATGQGVDNFGGLWWVLTPSGAARH